MTKTTTMNERELALAMLDWAELREQLEKLEEKIIPVVLEKKKTHVVGNVRARYYNPRKEYDYEKVGIHAPDDIIEDHTDQYGAVDWRKVCIDASITEIPYATGKASVALILE